jgi:hypothetical protein
MADVKSKVMRSSFPSTNRAPSYPYLPRQVYLISIEPLRATRYQPSSHLFISHLTDFSAGNDSDQDSDREAPEPTKVADKPTARSGKRDAPKEAPVVPQGDNAARGGRGGRRGGARGNEGGQSSASPM